MADIGDRLGPKDGSFDGGGAPSPLYPLSPLLPPYRLRSAREEESLRQTHWKDLFASDQPSDPWWLRTDALRSGGGVPFKHWNPSAAASNGDVQSLLRPPTVKPDGTVALSQDGASDEPHVAAGKGPRVVAQEAQPSSANSLIKTEEAPAEEEEEEDSPWEVTAKGEHGGERQQREVNYGGASRRSPTSAARRSWRESGRSVDRKYMSEAEAKAAYNVVDESGELFKIEDETGFAQGSARGVYGDAKASVEGSASRERVGGSVGASAEGGVAKAEGTLNSGGTLEGKAEGRALAAEAEARALAEFKFKEREATISGRLAASAVVVDGEIGGEVHITPRRVWNGVVVSGVNTVASWFRYGKQLEENVDLPDWGITLGGGVGGTVGLAGEISGQAYSSKKGVGAGGKVKLAPGIGGSIRANAGLRWGD